MAKIPLSKIRSPGGPLGVIERTTVALTNSVPIALWLDEEVVDVVLQQHPVSVQKVARHYEVVSGFRSFHAVSAVMSSETIISVQQDNMDEGKLVRVALFEIFANSFLYCSDAVEEKERIYRSLKNLSVVLRKEHGFVVPKRFSGRELKTLLGLEGRRITSSRKRKTELQRIMEP